MEVLKISFDQFYNLLLWINAYVNWYRFWDFPVCFFTCYPSLLINNDYENGWLYKHMYRSVYFDKCVLWNYFFINLLGKQFIFDLYLLQRHKQYCEEMYRKGDRTGICSKNYRYQRRKVRHLWSRPHQERHSQRNQYSQNVQGPWQYQ